MIRKDVVIAVLATFCLTVTLFMVLPTRSSSGSGEYDSWADINDDGKINMYDIAYAASRFNTAGDSTKNVSITSWADGLTEPSYKALNISYLCIDGSFNPGTSWISVGRYSRMSIILDVTRADVSPAGNYTIILSVNSLWWTHTDRFITGEDEPTNGLRYAIELNSGLAITPQSPIFLTETKAPLFVPQFLCLGPLPSAQSFTIYFNLYIYLRND